MESLRCETEWSDSLLARTAPPHHLRSVYRSVELRGRDRDASPHLAPGRRRCSSGLSACSTCGLPPGALSRRPLRRGWILGALPSANGGAANNLHVLLTLIRID